MSIKLSNLVEQKHAPWMCPYCERHAMVAPPESTYSTHTFHIKKDNVMLLRTRVVICPNQKCMEYSITASLHKGKLFFEGTWLEDGPAFQSWNLKPLSRSKTFPPYIPEALTKDYNEACLIQDLSPKASATLSRRCLQGMIRDFWEVKENRLVDAIAAIEGKVDPLTWQAIDAVRSIGNIGAHMEKDIDLIVEVDPDEARLLIGLIETLFKEWYINKEERKKNMQALIDTAAQKQQERKRP